MYTVVLMAAMSTSMEAPDRCGKNRCHSCNGCYSSYCHGGYGGGYCHGGYGGGYGCYGGGFYGGCGGGVVPGGPGGVPYQGAPRGKEPKTTQANTAPATLVVSLPADASLTINGTASITRSAQRTFTSPPLERGFSYYYDLQAEVTRDGQTVATTQRVAVTPGEQTRVSIELPQAASVASR